MTVLASFDVERFLRESWQQHPLLIRNPWDAWSNPLEPDELAGLACEPGVESRLVTGGSGDWKLEHGPFIETRFASLGTEPWTLLVQAVDHHVPSVAALLASFRFIPNWRIDDVMVSYATDGGGVGAHFDQYDVFLVQGLGQRRWQIGARCDGSTALRPHDDLRLLADFEPTEEWVLNPGDILYVPPGVAHNGVAVSDDCMTYSIGFRAPSRSELIAGFTEHLLSTTDEGDRYSDPGLARQENPGEIIAPALAQLRALILAGLRDEREFARWFGGYATAPKNPDIDWHCEEAPSTPEIRDLIQRGVALLRNPASRFALVRGEAGALTLFVDGNAYECAGAAAGFAKSLCAAECFTVGRDALNDIAALGLIEALLGQGSVAFDKDQAEA